MRKTASLIATMLFALLAALPAAAQGRYTELRPPQPTESAGKIEVVEFFWYGCIHCYNLEPVLEPWLKKLPPDAQFRRVPAVFNARWEHDARIFYTFEAMGLGTGSVAARLHAAKQAVRAGFAARLEPAA